MASIERGGAALSEQNRIRRIERPAETSSVDDVVEADAVSTNRSIRVQARQFDTEFRGNNIVGIETKHPIRANVSLSNRKPPLCSMRVELSREYADARVGGE